MEDTMLRDFALSTWNEDVLHKMQLGIIHDVKGCWETKNKDTKLDVKPLWQMETSLVLISIISPVPEVQWDREKGTHRRTHIVTIYSEKQLLI